MNSPCMSRWATIASVAFIASPFAQAQAELSGDTGNAQPLQRMMQDQFERDRELPPYEKEIQTAYSHLAEGNFNEAYRHLNYAIKEDPDRAEAYVGFAIAARAKEQYPAAERALRKAIDVEPDNARVRHELARLLLIKQTPEDALTEIDYAIHLDEGKDWKTQQVRAETLVALGRINEAADLYPKVVTLLEAKLSHVKKAITIEENKEEIVGIGQETEIVNSLGGGFQEIEVTRFDTIPKEAPEQWHRVKARLERDLESAQNRAAELAVAISP